MKRERDNYFFTFPIFPFTLLPFSLFCPSLFELALFSRVKNLPGAFGCKREVRQNSIRREAHCDAII